MLFNNAGLGLQVIADVTGKDRTMFWETPVDAWNALVETNVNGVFLMARAVAPTMIAQKFGKIINVSTNRHTMLRLGGSSYGGAKSFVETASRVWAKELEGTGVTVNVLLPGGPIDTGIRKGPLLDDKFWPITIMRAPTLWLSSDLSNGHTAQRFLARLWDEKLPLAGAHHRRTRRRHRQADDDVTPTNSFLLRRHPVGSVEHVLHHAELEPAPLRRSACPSALRPSRNSGCWRGRD